MVASKLPEDENKKASQSSNGGDIEEVLDVTIPSDVVIEVSVTGGRRRRESGIGCHGR